MSRLTRFLRSLLVRLLGIDPVETREEARVEIQSLARRIVELEHGFRNQSVRLSNLATDLGKFRGLVAVDWSPHDAGCVIVAVKTTSGDRVKVINVRRGLSIQEYRDIVADLKHRYGAKVAIVDGPIHPAMFD